MNVLILDNYDSFVYNIKEYIEELGAECLVRRNDELDTKMLKVLDPDAIIVSPGPGIPSNSRDFGICGDVLRTVSTSIPTLGVCLGHQGIAYFYGGRVVRAPSLVHGKTSFIHHNGNGIYEGMNNPFLAGRYHSFVVASDLPSCLELTAHTDDGVVMGIRHKKYPIEGVQFHPESILTPCGKILMSNFLRGARA